MSDVKTYKENRQILKDNLQVLQQSAEVDIDSLLGIVEASVDAYKQCASRIDAVEAALGEALKGLGND